MSWRLKLGIPGHTGLGRVSECAIDFDADEMSGQLILNFMFIFE